MALSSGDFPKLKSTQDIDKYADFITATISTAVDKDIPTSKSRHPESQLISDETLVLIKEKQIKAVTSCSTHKIDQQETDG